MANKLVLEMVADSNNLLKAMEQAQRSLNNFVKASEGAGQALGGGVNRAIDNFTNLSKGGALAAGVIAGAIVAVGAAATATAIQAGREAEALSQLSSITGIGTDALQEHEVLLNRVGLSGEDLTVVMRNLGKKMEEAQMGTGLAGDRFRQLGIDITKVTSTDDLIRKIADSVSRFSNGTEKAAIMADLLGKSGLKFIPAFEGGAKAIDEAADASKRLGATLTGVQLESLGRMDDAVDDLTLAWKRFSQQLGALVAPAVELVVNALTKLLAWGSNVFHELDTAAATLAIRFTHMGQTLAEVAKTVFSGDILSQEAWAATLENIKKIDAEAASLIAKRRALANVAPPPDVRTAPPKLVDSSKALERARTEADAALKFSESLFKNEEALNQARLDNFKATLESQKTINLTEELDIAQATQAAMERSSKFTIDSLESQIRNYSEYYKKKSTLFGSDEKSQADKAKFEFETSQQMVALLNQLEIAQIKSDTTRIQSAMQVEQAIRKSEIEPLEDAVKIADASFKQQQAWYQQAPGLIGQVDLAREKGMALIEAEGVLRLAQINQTIGDEQRKNELIMALDEELHAKRIGLINQFPTFWERQLNDIVQSNVFSLATITSNFNNATAQWIQGQGNFAQFWQQTQTTLLTSALQMTEQWLVQLGLAHLRELGLLAAQESSKTAIAVAGNAARVAADETANATIVASNTAAATASSAAWVGALQIVWGEIVLLGAAVKAFFVETIWPMIVQFATSVVSVIEAIATALGLTALFGNFWGAVAAGVLLAAAAGITAALAAGAFAEGGIVTGPTLGLMGEAGSPEAAIPLNDRGAAFMQQALGLGGGGTIIIRNELNGRVLTEEMMKNMPGIYRLKMGNR